MLKFRGGQLAHEKNEFLPHENYPLYTVFGIYRDHTIIPTHYSFYAYCFQSSLSDFALNFYTINFTLFPSIHFCFIYVSHPSVYTNAHIAATLETSTVSQSPASPLASPSNQSTPLLRQRQLLDAELPPKDSAGGLLRPTSINSDEDSQSTVPDCIHCDDDDDESSPVSYKHDDGPFPVSIYVHHAL